MSITTKPTNLAIGNIPTGTPLRVGEAAGGKIGDTVFKGGAGQIHIKGNIEKSWFREIE